jgi:hypothetical protein
MSRNKRDFPFIIGEFNLEVQRVDVVLLYDS